jgi:hypothetical protein
MITMDRQVKLTFYRHFKDHWYEVLEVAEHTETSEKLVIYKPLYGEMKTYARPLDMFLEEVPIEKENPTEQKYRFMTMLELGLTLNEIHKR